MIVYFNGRYMPKEEVRITPDDRGFLFADGIYEVVRAYGGVLFALQPHLDRFRRSLDAVRIEGVEAAAFGDIARRLIADNALTGEEAVVYLQVTRGAAPRRHAFPDPGTPPTVYATAYAIHPPEQAWADGAAVALVPDNRWSRCDIKSIALLPNILAHQQARDHGGIEGVFVRDGVVTEGTHANAAAVIDGQLVTHPKGPFILPGITRDVILTLCADLGLPVSETPVAEADFRAADEVLLLGTTTEVMPVVSIDGRPVGTGAPGPITRRLQEAFRVYTRGPGVARR